MALRRKTPADRLFYAILGLSLALIAVIYCAVNQPSSHLRFEVKERQKISVFDGQRLILQNVDSVAISSAGGENRILLNANDFIEDPHFVATYSEMQQFFIKQSQIYQLMSQHQQIFLQSGDHSSSTPYPVNIQPKRKLRDLPFEFWFQLAVSSIGFLLGCWIWALRPNEIAPRVFALLNAAYPVFAFSAAIYSTRDLALNAELFRVLVAINTGGALLYGCALISLFLVYPKQLIRTQWLWAIPIFFSGWWLLDTLFLLPEPSMGGDLPVTLQMLGAILCMVWQWRANRHDPRAKVALRWFALWILVSSGAFVFLVQSTQLLDIQLNMSQAYSFGFFLFVTIGIAIGLKRYQLFSLDRWAFGILYWLAGAILLVLLDAFLVMMLSPLMSLSLAILICGLIWLPVRGWLQARLLQRKKLSDSELFERILQVSFAVNEQERQLQWKALLNDLFQPLNLEISEHENNSQIEDNGLVMYTPQVAGLAAMRLSYPQQGRRLFNAYDQQLVQNLLPFLAQAVESRVAYDNGVREERHRIARDLHDDLGAKLLSGLYQKDVDQAKQAIRQAIAEMRTIVNGLLGTGVELNVVLQEFEHEVVTRLQSCGIELNWQQNLGDVPITLSYAQYRHYISMLREIISNIMKYANAQSVIIEISLLDSQLVSVICDDGNGFDGETNQSEGNGLKNLRERATELSATLHFQSLPEAKGSRVELIFPL
ncbi:MAG: two-component sensor histidine kinase [Acinetobacter sp.]|nr:two-component sensor histidine kinase [Acinetobacter sp.]